MEKVRIGIIGTGFARSTQIPAFMNCEGAEIVSVASGSREKAERTALEFQIPHFTDSWEELIDRDDVDLVSITTPPNLHYEMVLRALKADKHILCEKPMAMNHNQADEMARLAKSNGKLALIDHELRFLPGRRKAQQMIRDGEIGKIIHAKQTFRNGSRGASDIKWNWWSDANAGGGTLGAIGSHAFDSFRWMLSTEINEVFCLLKTNVREREDSDGISRNVTTDDEANMVIKFADGKLTERASGTANLSVVESGPYDFNFEIFGTDGAILISEIGDLFYSPAGSHNWREIEIEPIELASGIEKGGWSIGFSAFAKEIVSTLREGNTEIENAATFADGAAVQLAIDACRESSETGKMVAVTR